MDLKHIEIGHGFITFYGEDLGKINCLARTLQPCLPKEIRAYQRSSLRHLPGDPKIFHYHQEGGEPTLEYPDCYRHFHVLYPHRQPTKEDVDTLINIIKRVSPETRVTCTNYKLIDATTPLARRSRWLLKEWVKRRTDTVDEL